jgi:hypothetical protein
MRHAFARRTTPQVTSALRVGPVIFVRAQVRECEHRKALISSAS